MNLRRCKQYVWQRSGPDAAGRAGFVGGAVYIAALAQDAEAGLRQVILVDRNGQPAVWRGNYVSVRRTSF